MKTRTITLTHRPPIKIDAGEWPVIARGSYDAGTTKVHIRVRQHGDGRALVYGIYHHDPRPNGGGYCFKVGELMGAEEDRAAAVWGVARELSEHLGRRSTPIAINDARDACIADMRTE